MSELLDNINEYIQNSEELIEGLQKEALDTQQELEEVRSRPVIEKQAAIEAAGTLIGKGLISANNLSQTIDRLCADPLGVIAELTKTAALRPAPSMGAGTKKIGGGCISTENMSKADKALLTGLRLI